MKTAIAIILVISSFFTTVLWSCCRTASRMDRWEERQDDPKK